MRASDRAYVTLLEEIQGGDLAPGTVVGEVEQAERLGVSRTPMREAISKLVAGGLVKQQSPRVLVVAGFDARDIRDLFETRRALEETAARIAATRGDAPTFARLADAFTHAKPAAGEADADEYYALIAQFDEAIDAATDNAYLIQAVQTVRTHLARARRLARDNRDRLRASVEEHALIASAIAAHNADLAAHATHVHLHNALTAILSSIEGANTETGALKDVAPEGTQ